MVDKDGLTIIEQLSELLLRPVTEESRAKARLHLLDWIGCAIIGAREPAGRILLESIDRLNIGTVFAWGGLGNILEMDDVDKRALLHPGPSIVPAALICAYEQCVEINDLLDAIVRGYESTIRLGRALGLKHYAKWHSTGTCGLIGATSACASILKLSADQYSQSMALAVSQTAGFWQTRHESQSMGKQLHTAHAARAGLESALLAKSGFKGPLTVVEGEQGLFAATSEGASPISVLLDYGEHWLIHDVSFKPWPACRHAHPAIDAALEIRERGFEETNSIKVITYGDALKFCDNPNPQSPIEAKFSLQHSVAVSLLRGKPQLKDFSESAIYDKSIKKLRQNVTLEVGDQFKASYPAHFGAEINIGEHYVKVNDALGDPENPMTKEEIVKKSETLMRSAGVNNRLIEYICTSVINAEGSISTLHTQIQEALT